MFVPHLVYLTLFEREGGEVPPLSEARISPGFLPMNSISANSSRVFSRSAFIRVESPADASISR